MERRTVELVEHKNHNAHQQNKKLHRYLQQPVHDQAHLALLYASSGEVALHLALVGPEIGEGQKTAANDTAPESIAVFKIKGKIQNIHFPVGACNFKGFSKGNIERKVIQNQKKSDQHPEEDNRHLLLLGNAHGLGAAAYRINDHEHPNDDVEVN